MKSPYDIIVKPLVTEKAMKGIEKHQAYTFTVDKAANKQQIKNAVETIFPVKVDMVRTMQIKGKPKKHRQAMGQRPSWKKAVVTLKEGHRIEVI